MRRRRFIEAVGALSAVSGFAWTLPRFSRIHPGPSHEPAVPPVRFFIYDERYPEGQRAGLQWKGASVRTLGTSGEIVTLWREQIAGAAAAGPVRIAGLTQHSDFEIVRSLASLHRLRVIQQEHQFARARLGTLTAWLLG